MRNPLLAARLFNTPLMAHPDKAALVAEVLLRTEGLSSADQPVIMGHISVPDERTGLEADRIAGALDRNRLEPYPIVDGIAVIAIDGTTVNRGAFIGASSGLVSYQGIQAQVQRAMRSDQVRAVVFDIDSPGGEVAGVFETAGMIRDLGRTKPTMAIGSSMIGSAAYLLASQARAIVSPEDSMVGSIGSVIVHLDQSRRAANEGVTVTFIRSGTRKMEGNALEPLSDPLKAQMQAKVDESASRFMAKVAEARPGLTVDKLRSLEGAAFYGAEAFSLGLIDQVAEPSAAFAAFRAALNAA